MDKEECERLYLDLSEEHVDVYAYDEATGVLTHQRGASFTDIPKP